MIDFWNGYWSSQGINVCLYDYTSNQHKLSCLRPNISTLRFTLPHAALLAWNIPLLSQTVWCRVLGPHPEPALLGVLTDRVSECVAADLCAITLTARRGRQMRHNAGLGIPSHGCRKAGSPVSFLGCTDPYFSLFLFLRSGEADSCLIHWARCTMAVPEPDTWRRYAAVTRTKAGWWWQDCFYTLVLLPVVRSIGGTMHTSVLWALDEGLCSSSIYWAKTKI